jgi:RNA polymerase sigma-70 factor (ECF subfamily)
MTAASALAVSRAVDAVMRKDRGRLLAALIARFRDFQLAEDALQEAAASALVHWGRSGLPASPQGWLLKVAGTKAIDRMRKARRDGAQAAALAVLAPEEAEEDPDMFPDHRLRLIFTCCHPALDQKSRVALTLRTLGGLTTTQIARAFLDTEPTMGQRLSRAKTKIAAAGISFKLPDPEDLPDRLNSVLTVVYLIFNAGYTAGPGLDRDLCDEAIFLARLLNQLQPASAEVEGALALLLLTHARRAARVAKGVTVALTDQVPLEVGSPLMGINYGLEKVRFPAPVPVGSRIRARVGLVSVTDVEGGIQINRQVTIEVEGTEKPAMVAETVSRLYY